MEDFEYFRSLFDYDNQSGKLYWKVARSNAISIGDETGSLSKRGYLTVRVDGKLMMVHRIIWLISKGYWPEIVDHINGDRSDNRTDNLRDSNGLLNRQNVTKSHKDSKSKFLGVSWDKQRNKWKAQLTRNRKQIFRGHFNSEEEAYEAYLKARYDYDFRN